MDNYKAIKTSSLKNVLKPNFEYHIRKLYRWYSKQFHTPLQECFDIPVEIVLMHFFEEKYEAMNEEELQEEVHSLLETEDQRKERIEQEEQDKVAEYEMFRLAAQHNKKIEGKKKKLSETDLPASISKLTQKLNDVSEILKQDMAEDPPELPEIDIKFSETNDDEFQSLIDKDGVE